MIEIDELEARYSNGKGVGPVSFTVNSGEVVAVVGPNGSGKSTFFNTLAGVQAPDAGTWKVNGTDGSMIARKSVGFLSETPFLFPYFTARQQCEFDAAMRDIDLGPSEIDSALRLFDCDAFLDSKINTLSQGMAKRVALTCAFLGYPELVLLDEPLNALDIQTVIRLKERIEAERKRGCSIIVSSHVLDFVDKASSRILFLRDGLVARTVSTGDRSAEQIYSELFGAKDEEFSIRETRC